MSTLVLPDARLEMPALLYPKCKPVGKVKINWSHPLSNGLVGAFILNTNGAVINLVNNIKSTRYGGSFDADGSYKALSNNDRIITDVQVINSVSVFVDYTYISSGSNNAFCGSVPGTSNGIELVVTSTHEFWWATTGSFVLNKTGAFLVEGERYAIAVSTNENAGVLSYVNGSLVHEKLTGGDTSGGGVFGLLARGDNITLAGLGTIHFALIYDRTLSTVEQQALYENPYQFLEPA